MKSLPFDPGQPWRNAAPADTLQPGRLPNGLLAQGRQFGHGQAERGRGQAAALTRGLLNDGG